MQSFPMFIRTTGRRVVIAGGGEQAAQKARLMLKTDARLVLAAPVLEDELAALARAGRAEHHPSHPDTALLAGAAFAFVATGCAETNARLQALARAARCPVNVVDRPELCDLLTPSLVDRDPVVVAIGTEGTAPVLARQIKTRVEQMLPPTLGGLAALAGRLRASVAANVAVEKRRAFWAWVFSGAPRHFWQRGAEREAATAIKTAIAEGGAPGQAGGGAIAVIGAGSGTADLLTLRAVARLQEADVIFHGVGIDGSVLELARRDAERVALPPGPGSWPLDRIEGRILREARQGRRVVLLLPGGAASPMQTLLLTARREGVIVEEVPGVSAQARAGVRVA